jgi:hypothetical protein
MLTDILALVRGQGTNLDRVLGVGRETFGVIFHILRTVFNIEEMAQNHLVRPALEEEGKGEEAISKALSTSEEGWTAEAHNVIESVRTQLSQPSF